MNATAAQSAAFQVKMVKVFKDGHRVTDFFTNHKGMSYTEAYEWVASHPALKGFITASAGAAYRIENFEIVRMTAKEA